MTMSGHATALNLARTVLRAGYRVSMHGVEQVPSCGRVILAANHSGWLDGPLLPLATSRPIHVLAKHELWQGWASPLVSLGRAIPIDWQRADRGALLAARRRLAAEECVGIFPEGTRCRGDFAWLRDGISYLVGHTNADVVPVAIFGTRPTGADREHIARPGSPITISIGEVIRAAELVPVGFDPTRRAGFREIGLAIQQRLAAHVRQSADQHGVELPADDVSRPEDHRR